MMAEPTFAMTLGDRWQRLSLANSYALASGAVLLVLALVLGSWITNRIEATVVRNTASATALYMESFISPISQQLADQERLSPGAQRALEEVFTNTPLGERVLSYKIWRAGGLIVEASDKAIIGQRFEVTEELRRALAGEISAAFETLGDSEDAAESASGLPLLEVYSPIREVWSGEVIGVVEFYEVNYELRDDLAAARRSAWLTVAAIGGALGLLLYAIVLGGSRTIETQRRALDTRLAELRRMSDHNADLRFRVQGAAARAAAQTDQTMRRIGADLHDGPAQYLAFAALRLDALRGQLAPGTDMAEFAAVEEAITTAMTEVRAISRGLALPDIAGKPVVDIIRMAAEAHEVRTGTAATLMLDDCAGLGLDDAGRICVFRFVQEGLTNATRHAEGRGVEVEMACTGPHLRLTIRDAGPGLSPPADAGARRGLGLAGLHDRVESLGGSFTARSRAEGGTELCMTLDTGATP